MKAHDIMNASSSANNAKARALDTCAEVGIDHESDEPATLYLFDDESILAVFGGCVKAYETPDAASWDFGPLEDMFC